MPLVVSWEYWFGFITITFYILFPHLYALINRKDGFVWVPFNNQHLCGGDNRIYAAGVKEARANFFKFRHPCSSEIKGWAVDFLRFTSYRLAAILTIGIKDDRFAYLTSFTLSVILQYSLLCWLFYAFLSPMHIISVDAALLIIFFYKSTSSFFEKKLRFRLFVHYLFSVSKFTIYDRVNDNFRYVIMSSCGSLIWLSLFFNIYYFQLPFDILKVLSIPFFIIPFLFVYPIVSACCMFIFLWVNFSEICYRGDINNLIVLFFGGLLTASLFTILGLHKRIKDIISSEHNVLIQSHVAKEIYKLSFQTFFQFVLNDIFFLLSVFSLVYLNFSPTNQLNDIVSAIFIFIILLRLMGFIFKKNLLINRFYDRGVSHFFAFAFLFIVVSISQQLVNHYFFNLFFYLLLFFVFLIACYGSTRAAFEFHKYSSLLMPISEWNLYRYINKNTPSRANFLAFSFSNIQLLPVYTNANLEIRGAEWLDCPLNELVKYFKALEFIKVDINYFWNSFLEYHKISEPSDINEVNSEITYAHYHLFKSILYFPFVKRINHVNLFNEETKSWDVDFLALVLSRISIKKFNFSSKVDYIIIDKNLIASFSCSDNFSLVYENLRYKIFKNDLRLV